MYLLLFTENFIFDIMNLGSVAVTYRKESRAMLNKIKNQENIIMIFFVVTLLCVGVYVVVDRSIVDVIYLGVLGYYFGRFLIIKNRR